MPDANEDGLAALLAEHAEKEQKFEGEGDLETIVFLANKMRDLEMQVELSEASLRRTKEELRHVAMDELPEAFPVGMSEFKLDDGSIITIKSDTQTGIRAELKVEAHDWLKDNGHGSIVKHEITSVFAKGEDKQAAELAALLTSLDVPFSDNEAVNYQTLQAWGRREAEEGRQPPDEFFSTFDLKIAKIKAPKK